MAASITPLRVALTGFGQLAVDVHVPVLRRMPGVELVAVADTGPARRAILRQMVPRARFCESQDEMLSQSDIEAVVICASGATIGLVFGATLAYLIAAFAGWQVAWPPVLIVVSTLLCALVGLAFAVYPARQAALLDPITAIRAE